MAGHWVGAHRRDRGCRDGRGDREVENVGLTGVGVDDLGGPVGGPGSDVDQNCQLSRGIEADLRPREIGLATRVGDVHLQPRAALEAAAINVHGLIAVVAGNRIGAHRRDRGRRDSRLHREVENVGLPGVGVDNLGGPVGGPDSDVDQNCQLSRGIEADLRPREIGLATRVGDVHLQPRAALEAAAINVHGLIAVVAGNRIGAHRRDRGRRDSRLHREVENVGLPGVGVDNLGGPVGGPDSDVDQNCQLSRGIEADLRPREIGLATRVGDVHLQPRAALEAAAINVHGLIAVVAGNRVGAHRRDRGRRDGRRDREVENIGLAGIRVDNPRRPVGGPGADVDQNCQLSRGIEADLRPRKIGLATRVGDVHLQPRAALEAAAINVDGLVAVVARHRVGAHRRDCGRRDGRSTVCTGGQQKQDEEKPG